MQDRDPNPGRLSARDLRRLADQEQSVQGRLETGGLERLAQDLRAPPGAVDWRVHALWRRRADVAAELWMRVQARAEVTLTCQRCLGPLREELVVDREIRLARDEAEAQRLDEECDDDVVALPESGQRLDLGGLVEDELILALPLVPRHETCQPPAAAQAEEPAPSRPKPFEALAALKKRGPQG